jgi:uncharacterized protein (TIGR02001 family)
MMVNTNMGKTLTKLAQRLHNLSVFFLKEFGMKTLKLALIAAASAAVMAPAQAEGVSYNIGVVSLYKSSGVDADDRQAPADDGVKRAKNFRPAVQGGFDYDFGNGFYVGNWNSTGKFGKADFEIDLYAGYANELANGLGYDVGVTRFIYPGAETEGLNSNEAHVAISYGIATFKVTRGLTDGANKKYSRYSLTLSQPVNDKLTMNLVLADRNKRSGGHSDFAVGADYDLGDGMSLSAAVSGAGKKLDEDGVKQKLDTHKTRLVVGLSKSF